MKEGEKITINFANMPSGPGGRPQAAATAPAKKGLGGGLRKLAPPPGFKGKPRDNAAGASVDLLGGNSGASANPAPTDDLLGGGA